MRRSIGLVVAMTALAAPAAAQTVTETTTINSPGDRSCDGKEAAHHVMRARAIIRTGYDKSRYPDRTPMTGSEKHSLYLHKFCVLVPDLRDRISRYRERIAEKYRDGLVDESSWCSPTPIASGGGCWEIPVGCVMSESGGSWRAANPSGAVGPYQLLGHGAPFPVYTYEQAQAHHRIAAGLYASSGAWSLGGAGLLMDEPIMESSAAAYAARAEDCLAEASYLRAQALAMLAVASAVESLDLTINQINQQKESQ